MKASQRINHKLHNAFFNLKTKDSIMIKKMRIPSNTKMMISKIF